MPFIAFCSDLSKKMISLFSISIRLSPKDLPNVRRKCFVSCDVLLKETSTTKRLGYCLHCHRVFSLSWTKRHTRQIRNTDHNFSRFFNPDKMELYRQDITSEIELMYERGRLPSIPRSPQAPESSSRVDHLEREESALMDDNLEMVAHDVSLQEGNTSVSQPDEQRLHDIQREHECDCIKDCLLKTSFYRSEFDGYSFFYTCQNVDETSFQRFG